MSRFNVNALKNAMTKIGDGEKVAPKTTNLDPNKLSWPYVKLKDLKKDVGYDMRVLPAHPTKNPNGYIRKEMYQIPYKLNLDTKGWAQHDCKILTVPGCVDPNLPDPVGDILQKLILLTYGETAFEFIKTDIDDEGNETGEWRLKEGYEEPTMSDLFREECANCEELRVFVQTIGNVWIQNIMPVILWAECDGTKGEKYTTYSNYRPAEKEDENILTRRFQMTNVKPFYDEKVGFITKLKTKEELPESTPEEKSKKRNHIQWNSLTKGMNFTFTHTSGQGTSKAYTFEPALTEGISALPEVIAEKLEISDDNYPDLVQMELRSGLKSADEMLNIFTGSPYAKLLAPFGIFD